MKTVAAYTVRLKVENNLKDSAMDELLEAIEEADLEWLINDLIRAQVERRVPIRVEVITQEG